MLARDALLTDDRPASRHDWAMLGLQVAGPSGALSGWDAVRLRGVGPDRAPTGHVLVLCQGGHHRRLGRVLIRPTQRTFDTRLMPADHATLPWAQVAEHARSVADTALEMPLLGDVRDLVAASLRKQLCTIEDLQRNLETGPQRGSAWLRRAIEDALDGARSAAEAMVSDALTRARVPAFELNVPVVSCDGVVVAWLDVFWRALRLVLEIDSRKHHSERERDWEYTLGRHNALDRVDLHVEHHVPRLVERDLVQWGRDMRSSLTRRCEKVGLPFVPGSGPIRPGPDGPPPVHVSITSAEWDRIVARPALRDRDVGFRLQRRSR